MKKRDEVWEDRTRGVSASALDFRVHRTRNDDAAFAVVVVGPIRNRLNKTLVRDVM